MRGKSDELIQRTWNEGSLWRDGSLLFDLTASYQISKTMRVSFQAINLTDEETRNYFTSRTINLGDTQIIDGQEVAVLYDEGNPLEDSSVTQSRTQQLYKTGRTFRLDLRIDF
jgi:iron complex outermembrane recepter protein